MLPFTRDQFFAVFADYNLAVWPVQWFAALLGGAIVVALRRPSAAGDRLVGAGLALMWAWTGVAYHGVFFSAINRAAFGFGALFVVQALLFAHAALVSGDLRFGGAAGAARSAGWALIVYAALVYPLIGIGTGHRYPALPMFGITPCPVTLFSLGVLLLATPPAPRRLLVIPFAWTLVGGSAALLLGVAQDWPLLAAAAVPAYLAWRDRRRSPPA
ncbi:MAG: hypothetical protein J0L57_03170 [Burkholderiales bacterium]|nr:hypothetical protein [Burkholderiales bacterium]